MFDYTLFVVIIHDFSLTIQSQRYAILNHQPQAEGDMMASVLRFPNGKRFTDNFFHFSTGGHSFS